VVALGGAIRLPPMATFTLPRTKVAPTAFSPEVCLSGDIQQLLGGTRLIPSKLLDQGMTHLAGLEFQDDVSIGHPRELVALSGEAPNLISEGFTQLLPIALQVPGVAKTHIRAMDVAGEDVLEILPVFNDAPR
jgi:hypothetical protein